MTGSPDARTGTAGPAPPRPRLAVGLGAVAFMLVLYYGIQWLTGLLAIYPRLGLPAELARPGGWVQAFDHHFWQLALALVAIAVLGRLGHGLPDGARRGGAGIGSPDPSVLAGRSAGARRGGPGGFSWRAWGLNLDERAESVRVLRKFFLYYGVYFVGIGFVVRYLFFAPPALEPGPTALDVAGKLAFGFLFVGVSEEILFRGLIHTYLARYWTGVWRWRGYAMPVAGVMAAVIFTLAHIGFRLSPFGITHLYVPQLVLAFVLGLFYSAVYHRTGSLLAPIVAHNFSDGALWVGEYLLYALKG